jgi:hypothetical protein
MSEEIYRVITEYPNYSISNFGNVKNKNGDVLKQNLKEGLYRIGLCMNGKRNYYGIGQLVAKYFLNPDNNNFYVVYKNGNKLDNHVINLELKYCKPRTKIIHKTEQIVPINIIIKKYKLEGNWKYVKGEFNYIVSDNGKVFSIKDNKLLKIYKNNKTNYIYVTLNTYTNKFVHILIAESFLSLDFTRTYNIFHKDGDKSNNILSNIDVKYHKQEVNLPTIKEISLPNEQWKEIKDYENMFMVSDQGRILNLTTMKIKELKPHKHHGYVRAMLCKNGVKTQYPVHVLVARAFLNNPENKPQVNHIDGVKHNNKLSNLEWATPSENISHAIKTGLLKINTTKTNASQHKIKGEIWKVFQLNTNYLVSNKGRVKNATTNKILKGSVTNGYLHVHLSGEHKKSYNVHQLVALTFLPQIEGKPLINHKNGIKTNNNLKNLEWVSGTENNVHAFKTGLFKPKTRKVGQYDLNGNLIKEWNKMSDASEAVGIDSSKICAVCRGERKTTKGFIWKYLD